MSTVYEIALTEQGLEDAKKLPKNLRNNLQKALVRKLARDPVNCSVSLREVLAGWRSFHHRDLRVIFSIREHERLLIIAGIGTHAKGQEDIYRRLEAAARQGRLAEQLLRLTFT